MTIIPPHLTRRGLLGRSAGAGAAGLLAACGSGQASPPSAQTLKPATVRFTPAAGPGTDVASFEPLIPQYMQERPNVKVEVEVIPDGDWTKINALLVADSAADVSRINDDTVYQWGSSGKLTHLDPLVAKSMKRDDYFPPTWQAMSVDGKLFSMQTHLGINLFVYNADLLKKAGVVAPTSWAQAWDWNTFVTNMRKIATPNAPAGQEVYALTFPANYVIPLVWGNSPKQYNADETQCAFNTKEALEVLEEMQQLIYVHKLVTYGQNNRQLFNAGRLAMNWGDPQFGTQSPPELQWDIMPTPKTKKATFQEGYVRTFAIPKATKEVDASWDFMRWLMTQQPQVHLGRAGYGVPALKSAGDPTFKEGPLKDKNWKIIPDGLNVDVPLANNPVAGTFKDNFSKGPADRFLKNEIKAQELTETGCNDVNNKIRELNWKKKG
ncbi:MAG: extracellular solute-binding protein [Chloroflexota bacterium]|nr:extracellular solute-binding protein [Chloroflexota bacterium]